MAKRCISNGELNDAFMRRALELAKIGAGWANPNPMVGAVIVRDGRIIGEGWHTAFGELHAERQALAHAVEDVAGATMYVTLEPCCHTGKTPPCTDALIERGITHVVVGSPDPNPQVAGRGVELLRNAGIGVTEGFLVEECNALNRSFFHHITTGLPYVTLKYAMTLDGKIATRTGDSQWITGEISRARVHADRRRASAIVVGVGTILADDPLLTCRDTTPCPKVGPFEDVPPRYLEPHTPIRVVCDSHLRTPIDSRVVSSARKVPTLIATTVQDMARLEPYKNAGCRFVYVGEREGHLNLSQLMAALGKEGLSDVIVEGGGTLSFGMLQTGLVNRVQAYVGAKLFGGSAAKTPVEGLGFERVSDALVLHEPKVSILGEDVLIECEVG